MLWCQGVQNIGLSNHKLKSMLTCFLPKCRCFALLGKIIRVVSCCLPWYCYFGVALLFGWLYLSNTSETEIKLFQPLELFQNYFSDIEHVGKYSWAAISLGSNLWNNFRQLSTRWNKIISVGCRRRLKYFWNDFISLVTTALMLFRFWCCNLVVVWFDLNQSFALVKWFAGMIVDCLWNGL